MFEPTRINPLKSTVSEKMFVVETAFDMNTFPLTPNVNDPGVTFPVTMTFPLAVTFVVRTFVIEAAFAEKRLPNVYSLLMKYKVVGIVSLASPAI